ncbi:heterogeneous nuclear ribonucleoprotein R-like [Watersipora subatra]|uniref:heterogeneous nuclear ribonucleoprotein R-like n=1 Tax=Watersipora subatra TaxID=2589382 RepID=UPI00355C7AF3
MENAEVIENSDQLAPCEQEKEEVNDGHVQDTQEPLNGGETSEPKADESGKKENQSTSDEDIDAMTHSDYYNKLVELGLMKLTAWECEKLVDGGHVTESDLDERALSALKEFDVGHAKTVLQEFSSSDLSHVMNKSAYLCGMLKTFRQRLAMKTSNPSGTPTVGPTKEQLADILKSGYTLDITTGQRKYGGPPPDWEGPPPGTGHEVFIGRIPRELFEDVLVPVFQKAGKIWDFRLMIDSLSGYNRGYAFCTYCSKEGAKAAVKDINDKEIVPGKTIKVNISVANVRLFVGNIPKQKAKNEIQEEFSKLTEGLVDVIIYNNPGEMIKKNRGFAFLEYDTHKSASSAKRKLGNGRCRVWNCDLIIDWADPQEEPSEDIMSTVKVLYVKGLLADVTEEELKEKFEPYGKLDRVRKVKDYAFIHFSERENCMTALNDLNHQKVGDSTMEISLAKPQDKNKEKRRQREMPMGPFRGGPIGPRFGRGGAFRGRGGYGAEYGSSDFGYRGGYGGGYGGGYADDYSFDHYGGGGYDHYGYGPPPRPRIDRGGWRGVGGPRGAPPRGAYRGAPRGGFKRPLEGGMGGGKRSRMEGWQPGGGQEFYHDSW